MAFRLTSQAFEDGRPIPTVHTADGDDRSPPLAWTAPPAGTRGFALVCVDPDAPRGTFRHWGVHGIPADADHLPAGFRSRPGDRIRETDNDFGRHGYGGPAPPRHDPPHRYLFRLYALDVDDLRLPPGGRVDALERAAARHALGEAVLTGRYGRGGAT